MFKFIKRIRDEIRFKRTGITEKAFNAEVARIKEQNKIYLTEFLAATVRKTALQETGLLQSDAYCISTAKMMLKTYRESGAVDELYCIAEDFTC